MKVFLLLSLVAACQAAFAPPQRISGSPIAKKKFGVDPQNPQDDATSFVLNTYISYVDDDTRGLMPIRYFVNSTFMLDDTSPIMIQMGGEGTANGVHCNDDMISNNAICVQIEHRFYGESVPSLENGGGSNANLAAGLSVEYNALDTALVLAEVQEMFGNKGRPVVNFGGSYSGATATWFRMQYPDSTDGAVSSSGVVNAIYEFVEFDEVIAEAINTPDTNCADRVRRVQQIIDSQFNNNNGDAMKEVFNATNLIGTKMGDSDFMYMVADGFSMIDQYGGKKELCDGLAKVGDDASDDAKVANLADVLMAHFGSDFGQDCYYDSECLKIENNDSPVGGLMGSQNSRSWRWQKCAQVAYLQSQPADKSVALRSELLTIEVLEEQCEYVFSQIPAKYGGNNKLNMKFGADHPEKSSLGATNVFSISYSDDPWKAASVTEAHGTSLPYCYTKCDGCGHCGAGVGTEDAKICGDPQAAFVRQVVAQARFGGTYEDPNHPGCTRTVDVVVSGEDDQATVSGADFDEEGNLVEWGPLNADVNGVKIIVDFSPKGGPSDLTGRWNPNTKGIDWEDGNTWPKVL